MSQYTTLLGAEQVQSAANTIREAASQMQSAAGSIEYALQQHQRFLEQWLSELREVMSPPKRESI